MAPTTDHLVGLLLGWHTPSSGRVRVDGEPLEGAVLATVRRSTAWVDPETRLWNRALLDRKTPVLPIG